MTVRCRECPTPLSRYNRSDICALCEKKGHFANERWGKNGRKRKTPKPSKPPTYHLCPTCDRFCSKDGCRFCETEVYSAADKGRKIDALGRVYP